MSRLLLKYIYTFKCSIIIFIGEEFDDSSDPNNDGKIYIFYGYLVTSILVAIAGCGWIFITWVNILDPIRESHR